MAIDQDKPIDIIDEHRKDDGQLPRQSEEKEKLAQRVQQLFRAAWDAKENLGLPETWRKCDDYKQSRQNPQQSHDHPGSVTNMIHSIIESQIGDLVDKPFNVSAKGWEPSDDMYAEQAQNLMDFVLYRNKFPTKMNVAEHDRLELGTTIIKVWFDDDELDGRGLPKFDPVSPANFFPDPKIARSDLLQDGEFVIHAVPRPLSWIRKKFEKWGKYVRREVTVPYDPESTFTDAQSDEVSPETSQRALVLECYMKDEDGELYCVHVANNIVLEDSREKNVKVQRRNKYPFVMIPCYLKRGTAWGYGDVELLMPTQDLINELDDQIRMNSRLSGNPQIVVGQGAGKRFDFRKWTNKPGLRIPMRDHNAWSIVPPQNVSSDVIVRREKAFAEADMVSGRSDVTRGEKPGQVTAAAAIVALQQAGQKGVIHKAKMFKDGWSEVLELLFDEVIENWDDEMWVRIDGEEPDYQFFNPAELKERPILIPNDVPGEESLVPLIDYEEDEEGNRKEKPMTRDAQYDFMLNIGDGLPTDKAFIYQSLLDLCNIQYPEGRVIKYNELRDYLRNQMGLPLKNDDEPDAAQQAPPGPPPGAPPMDPSMMPQQPMPEPQGAPQVPPEVLQAAAMQLQQNQQQPVPVPGGELVG